jgi:arylsulfatase A-like enzyme
LYLQYMEPHAPYEPDEVFRAQFAPPRADTKDAATLNHDLVSMRWHNLTRDDVAFLASLYDAAVATIDAELRQLFGELERRGFLKNAVVVITADHGEEFWEHGALTHGTNLYNENVRIPLIVVAPGYAGGQRIDDNVSLIDVAPTLLDLAGLRREPRFEGRTLVPWLRPRSISARAQALWHRAPPATPIVLQLESTGYGMDVREHSAGLVQRSTKLLLRPGGAPEVYDLERDPAEKTADPALEAQSSALTQTLESVRADLRDRAGTVVQTVPLDAATREKLRALGYHF